MNKKLNLSVLSVLFLMVIGISSLMMSMNLIYLGMSVFVEIELISLNSLSIEMVLMIDWISMFFFFCVMMISSMVIFYSMSYMEGEVYMERFIMLIILFVLSMVLLIFSLNLISILLGWDGLGLVSFCLVIYYQNSKSLNSGVLTILSNRVGDVLILLSISYFINFGSWNFLIYSKIMFLNEKMMTLILMMMILAAMTKSAQIPFAAWLPAAMAAPTPISALVHSSTLVTAGVYLLVRMVEFDKFNLILNFLLVVASLTMFMAGISANFEFDLKKIIALSTLSQLGLMMAILCLGFKNLAFFHLCSHAMFKSLLFMCAGMIIHNMKNWQDIRMMGGIGNFMPMVFINLNIANLALCGMPFLAGFYSKDLILEMVMFSNFNLVIFFFFFFSIGLTVSYSVRLIYLNFLKEWNLSSYFSLYDKDLVMLFSMIFLLLMSIMGGSMMMWLILPSFYLIFFSVYMKFMVLFVMSIGFLLGVVVSKFNLLLSNKYSLKVLFFFSLMWFIPNISLFMFNNYLLKLSLKIDKVLDLGWLEIFGSMNMYNYLISLGKLNYYAQINHLKIFIYLFAFLFFIVILI
uniref:NADH dehydrogenase subunit 5 n=1 Tax=Cheumatopsyche brevilineata TaxID=1437087 RepID=UPI0022389C04|nr:NADH dehydrogenase subunit 5 [Cheumatopsyche brevilineata]UYO79208.1 NADH dehydrogenase subunit 5 [Cheumatopsyche brevilineata]